MLPSFGLMCANLRLDLILTHLGDLSILDTREFSVTSSFHHGESARQTFGNEWPVLQLIPEMFSMRLSFSLPNVIAMFTYILRPSIIKFIVRGSKVK